jgi:FAD/FMN-containing dehydrogenase/Fe-S oxidoreductase
MPGTTAEVLNWITPLPEHGPSGPQLQSLAEELRQAIQGEVHFSEGYRAMYSSDGSAYRQVPIGVVVPRSTEDVVRAVAICREHEVPVLPVGARTSLDGQACNVAVMIDFSKHLNRVLEINPEERYAWVEPGVIWTSLAEETRKHHLTLGPNPGTRQWVTLGGMIGNNACGSHSVMGGCTVNIVEEMEILTYEGDRFTVGKVGSEAELDRIVAEGGPRGEMYGRLKELRDRHAEEIRERYPDIPRRASGYSLNYLLPEHGFDVARALVGSEGTCAFVLRAKVHLMPYPPKKTWMLIGYENVWEAGEHVPEIFEMGPSALEGVDHTLTDNIQEKDKPKKALKGIDILPKGNAWLMVEFRGMSQEEANRGAHEARRKIEERGGKHLEIRIYEDPAEQKKVLKIRESADGVSWVMHDEAGWSGWHDTAVHPTKEGEYLRDFVELLKRYGYHYTVYGHFGQGCIHSRIGFDLKSEEGVNKYRAFASDLTDLVLSYGGSLSGEHGDGQNKGEFLPRMFGPRLIEAHREFKRIWDPHWKMNPGKVVDPYPTDAGFRTGPDYEPQPISTHFRFPEDRGSMALATERCVGIGKCRRLGGGYMCPSFQVLREEKHTTRGRARILFEMLRGDSPISDETWKSEEVKESLDLCLSCKGCKHDCPESVDIATYKAEFLSHYYEGRLRPRQAYAFGLIEWWSRLASLAPDLVNIITQTPRLDAIAKQVAGMALERRIPAFAPRTFREWWQQRETNNEDGPRVLLWVDAYYNHFFPAVLQAGVEVLEHAGYRVIVPGQWLASGRPLYEYGMLDLAKRQLRQVLDALREEIRSGTSMVSLEPSDTSVFRDELVGLFPDDPDAQRLSEQTFTLGEFLTGQAEGYQPPRLDGRKAIVQVHCHHHSVMRSNTEMQILHQMGIQVDMPNQGCCGMAGAFGFEEGQKHEVSVARGEQELLPAVRKASEDTLIITDGFSCREQIRQETERGALHLAEVIQMALHRGQIAETGRPEAAITRVQPEDLTRPTSPVVGAALGGVLLLVGGAAVSGLASALEGRDDRGDGSGPTTYERVRMRRTEATARRRRTRRGQELDEMARTWS